MFSKNNPEFVRNIWLEINPFRLFATPIILIMLLSCFYLYGKDLNHSIRNIVNIAWILYFVFIFIIGTSKSAHSIFEEVSNKTWDFQKMSQISPIKIILGKLLGSTSFCWYVGLLCLFIYIAGINFLENNDYQTRSLFSHYRNHSSLLSRICFLILAGILAQLTTMFFGLLAISSDKTFAHIKTRVVLYQIIAIISVLKFVSASIDIKIAKIPEIAWYNNTYDIYNFLLIYLIICIIWMFIGSVRLVMKDFLYNLKPYFWLLFTIYYIFYFNGFQNHANEKIFIIFPFLITIVLTYLTILTTPKNFLSYKKISSHLKSKKWHMVFEDMPLWLFSYLLIIPTIIYTIFKIILSDANLLQSSILVAITLSIFMFVTRDILIFYYCSLSSKKPHSNVRPLLYIGILYFIMPAIFFAINSQLTSLFIPGISIIFNKSKNFFHILEILIPAMINLGIIVSLLIYRIKKLSKTTPIQ